MGCKEPADSDKSLRVSIIDVNVDRAMGVQIQKARCKQRTAGIHGLCVNGLRYAAYGLDNAVSAQKRAGDDPILCQNAGILNIRSFHAYTALSDATSLARIMASG